MLRKTPVLLLPIFFVSLCTAAEEPLVPGPSLFWNPIAYFQKAVKDPAAEVGHSYINHATADLTQQILPATRDNLQQVGTHLGTVINNDVLPQAEVRLQNVATHAVAELKATLKSTVLACCWVGVAFFGAKLAYDNIKDHDGELRSKQTAKAACGVACVALALWGVYNSF